ncbi:thiopeptide-type bacteriocin biosynthesis protein [Aquimarina gracilis]|uniref:Thiopeptide-type bacteriocin biosynthesis protein n=1 Tax=Aquimarina gracilis TaxID=874422 RepID=A0ABU6A0G9_9FLAO|nr:thiopeptide-type bacteriocin biosynthesis protein [Aquimarina gracilis]MEB3347555.1 thiopeptide-type bacteriocin biosynthesis protein [Aquimarina gracilis]
MLKKTSNIKRKFIIGSEWLSYKIYMGTQTTDTFVKTQLPGILANLEKRECINDWFFIRYADPDLHLRLRFRLKDPHKISDITSALYQVLEPLLEDRLIHKVQIDTYSRELERYGYHTIEESEELFGINSNMIISLLNAINDDENKRWLWGMKAIDVLLNEFDYNLQEKRDLLLELKTDFGNEFRVNKAIRKQLSMKFRKYRKHIVELLHQESQNEVDIQLKGYSKAYNQIAKKIALKTGPGNFKKHSDYLMYSYLHMHCNRLFPSKQRMNEWVLYDLLYQHYYSEYARKKKQNEVMRVAV